ncbi:DUF1080 domain-containing protein [Aliifodinibius salicampi]|uniref:DUF1080 domain-containing protein n=1 Tax=Fodinibius salicampi TaxID=1920655 RepID=A0ABT3PVQ3_9BACT|nr:family 16 glycoside hydrolase [Fodinibius salicampi]MCW9711923.1 DUF1080 domain-containing protein [Fodinibius salicampi]
MLTKSIQQKLLRKQRTLPQFTYLNVLYRFLFRLSLVTVVVLGSGSFIAQAQTTDDLTLQDLSAFQDPGESWSIVEGVSASLEEANAISTRKGTGVLVNDPSDHQGKDLFTNFEHGDIDLELEYMMAKESNSGIYLQGRYEVQLLDSWTTKNPSSGDNGGIYERWDENRPEGQKGFQGYPPRQNASRAPGLWQHLKISFQAPRFDDIGNKIENAKIIEATLNGVTIHEDVELLGPTRGAIGNAEVSQGPLRFQGDHGAIAFRNISMNRFDQQAPSADNITFNIFEGAFREVPDFDTLTAVHSGKAKHLTTNLGPLPDQFLIDYEGTLNIKEASNYTFELNASGGGGLLLIDGEEVIGIDEEEGSLSLEAGNIPFKLYYARQEQWGSPGFNLTVSSEGLRPYQLSDQRVTGQSSVNPIYVEAEDEPVLRSFRDLPDGSRLTHAISVSSPNNIHYTYDLKKGNIVQIWRGRFLDVTPMWHNRGDGSSRPTGSVEQLLDQPAFAVAQLGDKQEAWESDTAENAFNTKGYQLDRNDNPTFKYQVYGTDIEDKIRVLPEANGVKRTMNFQNIAEDLYVRIAVGQSIEKGNNNRYLVNDQSYYLELDDSLNAEAFIRTIEDQQELIVPATSTLNYTILF